MADSITPKIESSDLSEELFYRAFQEPFLPLRAPASIDNSGTVVGFDLHKTCLECAGGE